MTPRWINVRMDRELYGQMAKAAKADRRSITSWLDGAVREVLGAHSRRPALALPEGPAEEWVRLAVERVLAEKQAA